MLKGTMNGIFRFKFSGKMLIQAAGVFLGTF